MPDSPMVPCELRRVVTHDTAERQYIFLAEKDGERWFPIVIGSGEAGEIQRVLMNRHPERPLTHQLAFSAIEALGSRIDAVEIVDLRQNTFFARMVLRGADGAEPAVVDARPSDAIALALRARCPIRVSESVLAAAATTDDE